LWEVTGRRIPVRHRGFSSFHGKLGHFTFSWNSSEHKNQRASERSWSSAFPLSEGDLCEKQRERGNNGGKAVLISVVLTEVARALFHV